MQCPQLSRPVRFLEEQQSFSSYVGYKPWRQSGYAEVDELLQRLLGEAGWELRFQNCSDIAEKIQLYLDLLVQMATLGSQALPQQLALAIRIRQELSSNESVAGFQSVLQETCIVEILLQILQVPCDQSSGAQDFEILRALRLEAGWSLTNMAFCDERSLAILITNQAFI
mmetsp:Transcript_18407/g.31482  ORF Transcript_18407/g.31482 Transcript_18407/m.31482 type:complete len:170 (+) Transcript_18407:309-818(+)